MDAKVKAKWLRALRGGKYKQAKNVLRNEKDRFCCLGVLCDLYAKETGEEWKKTKGDDWEYTPWAFGRRRQDLPMNVRKWAGIGDSAGRLPDDHRYETLADANDEGVRFPAIANIIEKHF